MFKVISLSRYFSTSDFFFVYQPPLFLEQISLLFFVKTGEDLGMILQLELHVHLQGGVILMKK